jgi:hypothetical protein
MRKLFIGAFLLLAAASCKKEGEILHVNENSSFTASLQVSTDSVTLSPANDNDSVLTFTWPAVTYGNPVAVTYTLELDMPGDTAGATGWAKAQSFVAGNNVLTLSFAGKDLNNLMESRGVVCPTSLVFRVL